MVTTFTSPTFKVPKSTTFFSNSISAPVPVYAGFASFYCACKPMPKPKQSKQTRSSNFFIAFGF